MDIVHVLWWLSFAPLLDSAIANLGSANRIRRIYGGILLAIAFLSNVGYLLGFMANFKEWWKL